MSNKLITITNINNNFTLSRSLTWLEDKVKVKQLVIGEKYSKTLYTFPQVGVCKVSLRWVYVRCKASLRWVISQGCPSYVFRPNLFRQSTQITLLSALFGSFVL